VELSSMSVLEISQPKRGPGGDVALECMKDEDEVGYPADQ